MNLVIADNILHQLKLQEKSKSDLATGIGIDIQDLRRMLDGSVCINAYTLKDIANFLSVTTESLTKLPRSLMTDGIMHMFSEWIISEEGKNTVLIADTVSDLIIFHSKVRRNGTTMMEQACS